MRLTRLGSPVGRWEALSTINGGGGPDNVTTTTLSEPPGFLAGPLAQAAGHAGSRFLSQQTQDPSTGLGGTEINDNASNLVNQTLQGDFLNSNPFLDQTFNRAADLTRGRLDTEFAGSGRNLGAAQPARSEELQTLASNIYGGNFQAERDRQQGALGLAQGFDPINQYINRLAGIIPGAGGVSTSTQPVFQQGLFG